MKPYGWAGMPVIGSLDGVDNPRPIVVQCHQENKSEIIHYILGTRKSACGMAIFQSSFLAGQSHESVLIPDISDETNERMKFSLICPDCKEYCDKK